MSNNYYFSHDYNAVNDPKLQKVLMVMGQEGIGIYWCLVEKMYEQNGVLELSECDSYAFALHTTKEKILQLIDLVFEKKQSTFTSASVLRRLKERIAKSKSASKSAKLRWTNKYALAMRSHSEGNATKQSKTKQNKTNNKREYGSLILLTDKEFELVATDYKVPLAFVRSVYDDMCNYCASKGKVYRDYLATLRNWVKRDAIKLVQEGGKRDKYAAIDASNL